MMTVSPASGGKSMKTPERPLHDYMAEVSERTEVRSGVPLPLGTHESEDGVNFALFSRHASRVRLALFDQPIDATPAKIFDLLRRKPPTAVREVWVSRNWSSARTAGSAVERSVAHSRSNRGDPAGGWPARRQPAHHDAGSQDSRPDHSKGGHLTLMWIAANRDLRAFDDPDGVKIERSNEASMVWGQARNARCARGTARADEML